MARLRKEEEARSYERMVNPALPSETFSQRFPGSRIQHLMPSNPKDYEDDDITYAEVNRQVALIFNVLISIVACAVAIWVAARHWRIEARLALSMTGSLVVGVAEVVIYSGYLRRLQEAKVNEKKKVEVKSIQDTWVIESKPSKGKETESGVKKRRI
ncbi:hypothetical protein BT63DRAFT_423165 [Microthyrium microscopicum]|uniref:Uncharacterized protein n=1 Tax=Microthyrium microscopicum TaxID=703497 RepID=A0A6A6UGF0_9PEZI|nr:hypothetical protein BT63DRAFT_423165 [Microthyrium microscopicum]